MPDISRHLHGSAQMSHHLLQRPWKPEITKVLNVDHPYVKSLQGDGAFRLCRRDCTKDRSSQSWIKRAVNEARSYDAITRLGAIVSFSVWDLPIEFVVEAGVDHLVQLIVPFGGYVPRNPQL